MKVRIRSIKLFALIDAELVTDEAGGEAWMEDFRPRRKRKR
jgi:hypothetical protein